MEAGQWRATRYGLPPDRSRAWHGVRPLVIWAARDRYIGWSAEARRRNIRFIAYNTRFPDSAVGSKFPHLASHILGRVTSALPGDWERMYKPSGLLRRDLHRSRPFSWDLLTAPANWVLMGRTTGRGKASNSYTRTAPLKRSLGWL